VLLRRAVILNNVTQIVLTKLDILDALKEIKICTAYKHNGQVLKNFPLDLSSVTPVYETVKGWNKKTEDIRSYKKLPLEAKNYIAKIEKFLKCKISYVSVGQMREAIIRK
jgi:adenylosuccinate synthase